MNRRLTRATFEPDGSLLWGIIALVLWVGLLMFAGVEPDASEPGEAILPREACLTDTECMHAHCRDRDCDGGP